MEDKRQTLDRISIRIVQLLRILPFVIATAIIVTVLLFGGTSASAQADPPSTDATLSGLTLSGTTYWHPSFDPATTVYVVQVGIDVSEVTVTATRNHRAARVVIKRQVFGSFLNSDGTVPLVRGHNNVRVEVTAQDRTTTKTYYLLITRTATPPPVTGELSTDDPPVNFRLTGFDHDSSGVAWEVPRGRHISKYEMKKYEHNGSEFVHFGLEIEGEASGGSGHGLSSVDLKPDTLYKYDLALMNDALIPIIEASVTFRTLPLPDPTDATLSNLTLRDIDFGTFDPETTSYTASVPNSASNTAIAPTVNKRNGATFVISANGVEYPDFLVKVVLLSVGSNTIQVKVTSEDGETTKTYTVTVTRAASTEVTPTATSSPTPEPTPTPTTAPTPPVVIEHTATPTSEPTATSSPTPEPTPTPTTAPTATATSIVPKVPEEVLNRLSALEALVATLKEAIIALTSRIAVLEAGEPTAATPMPTATPSAEAPTPTPTSSPMPVADACIERISGNATIQGNWAAECESKSASPHDGGVRYARYYTFDLPGKSDVTITLQSGSIQNGDTVLYLRRGEDNTEKGDREIENDDHGDDDSNKFDLPLYASGITVDLQPGKYTIEATTYYSEQAGDFTLTVASIASAQ